MADLRQRQSILIADDVPENIELLAAILEDEYTIKVAPNGEKALKIAYSDTPPDLILLDVMMPGLSGHGVPPAESQPDRQHIPVIFVTAMCSVEDEKLGLEIGAVDYITKPISPPVVKARVRTHLALYDQTRELERMVASAPTSCSPRASKSSSAWGVPPNSRTTKPAIMSSAWRMPPG
jgi:putative two-component system response regulator